MPKALDLVGRRFGRLLVLERAAVTGARNAMWRCKCDCGNYTTAAASNLGKTKFSCGCFQAESARSTLGVNRLSRDHLHGLSQTPEWGAWSRMKDRCYNPNYEKYHRYGARGIEVCERWRENFEAFYEDMGKRPSKRHSIDRIDNDGDYRPGNCRWATNRVQTMNSTTPHFIAINGVSRCVTDWCEFLDVPKWKAYDMTRNRGANRDLPPRFITIEAAVRHLHRRQSA